MTAPIRHRPIFGDVFGNGRYSLATMPRIDNGLHAVRYFVIEPRAGAVIAQADDKSEVLATARRSLLATSAADQCIGSDGLGEQTALWPSEELPVPLTGARRRPISRRRREIFERSNSRCHYCRAALSLEGEWHIEHLVPRALGGNDRPINLVAACPRCNLEKSDKSALEFILLRRGDREA